MLEIKYHEKIYIFTTKSTVQIATHGSYGNSGISLKEAISVQKIIAQIAPEKVGEILAVKFQGQILAVNSTIENSGEIDFITLADDLGWNLLLNRIAVYWDMAYRQIAENVVHYQYDIGTNQAILSYFLPEKFTADFLDKITEHAGELKKQDFSLETVLISAADTIEYYYQNGEWYLAEQAILEDSDYPYKFVRINGYLYRDNGLFVPLNHSLEEILVDNVSYQAVDGRLVGVINLKLLR